MFINKIELTKSKTLGSSVSSKVSFNKITITMGAELTINDYPSECYEKLSKQLDEALHVEKKKLYAI